MALCRREVSFGLVKSSGAALLCIYSLIGSLPHVTTALSPQLPIPVVIT